MKLNSALPRLASLSIVICDDAYDIPNRYLEPKDWHGGCSLPHAGNYCHRVQKKWNKRFGTHQVKAVPDGQVFFHRDSGKAVMNSVTWKQWQEKLA